MVLAAVGLLLFLGKSLARSTRPHGGGNYLTWVDPQCATHYFLRPILSEIYFSLLFSLLNFPTTCISHFFPNRLHNFPLNSSLFLKIFQKSIYIITFFSSPLSPTPPFYLKQKGKNISFKWFSHFFGLNIFSKFSINAKNIDISNIRWNTNNNNGTLWSIYRFFDIDILLSKKL